MGDLNTIRPAIIILSFKKMLHNAFLFGAFQTRAYHMPDESGVRSRVEMSLSTRQVHNCVFVNL